MNLLAMVFQACGDGIGSFRRNGGAQAPPPLPGPLRPQGRRGREEAIAAYVPPPPFRGEGGQGEVGVGAAAARRT